MIKLLLLLVISFNFAAGASAYPLIKIGPYEWYDVSDLVYEEDYWTMGGTSNPSANDISNLVNGGTAFLQVYKQNVGEMDDSGLYAPSYFTEYTPSIDPSGANIKWIFGSPYIEMDGVSAYLVIKDGNHDPSIYIFDLKVLGWNGMDTIYLKDFWPNAGAISYISIYDPITAVPEPATMFLLGSGLIGLAGYGKKKFFKK